MRGMPDAKYPLRLRLRAARVLADKTQTDMAEDMGSGYERATISNIESGVRRKIEAHEVVKWARATGVPVEFFTLDIDGLAGMPPADPYEALAALDQRLSDATRKGLV
jgi:transcriptional regulator with XRE-family HTH domain